MSPFYLSISILRTVACVINLAFVGFNPRSFYSHAEIRRGENSWWKAKAVEKVRILWRLLVSVRLKLTLHRLKPDGICGACSFQLG